MCGIAGILSFTGAPDAESVDRMVDLLEHRGPDDRGVFVEGPLGFGMRRLSIIDLSTGKQPIFNEDESMCIVFNGEIYNYPALREALLQKGHRFKTTSDTETILHLYEEYGASCVDHLQGMFAFAIWERKKNKLFIARDRFGIKPLFYFWDGSTLLFASETKSIAEHPLVQKRLDLNSASHFFTYLYFPHESSPFENVKKLLPGHHLTIEDEQLSIASYYTLPSESPPERTSEEWVDAFFETAKEVIGGHLLSEVPLGAFLSGGIDSSLVVAIMSQLSDRPVDTFSIGYDAAGASFDERVYAKQVADLFNCNHRELIVTPELVTERLPELLTRLDEPYGDASVIPNYLLSEYTKNFVTVALSGLGGDEVCGGYERYLGALLAERFKAVTPLVTNPLIRPLVDSLPDSKKGSHLPERLKRFVRYAAMPLGDRYFHFIAKFTEQDKRSLLSDDFRNSLSSDASHSLYNQYWARSEGMSTLQRLLKMDFDTYLVDDLLALSDRTSMAHSLEMRVPFVDHKMVEFFWNIPDQFKIKGTNKKYLLKKAAERVLPHEVIYRKKKGFSVPLTIWFRDALKPFITEVLSDDSLTRSGYFNTKYVQQILDEHMRGQRNHDEKLFALLSFSVWHNRYL